MSPAPDRLSDAIVVTGMHRTGSSAMTRVLALAGAGLPARLLDASPGNPTGHWEPIELLRLNDAMLAALDSDWCDPRGFRLRGGAALCNPYWFDRAHQVLREDFGEGGRVVIKDPRASLLMAFWPRALAQASFRPHAVIMVRDPLSVAGSLARRDGFPISQSVLLWMSYMLAAERDTRGLPRVFVAYDDLIDDWRAVLARIGRELGIAPFDAQADAIEAFLDRELRHFDASSLRATRVWRPAEVVGEAFAAAARGGSVDLGAFDAARAELEAIMAIVDGALENLRGDRRRLERRVAALGG